MPVAPSILPHLAPRGGRLPVVDMHCAGEPVRIFDAQDLPQGDAASMLEKRRHFARHHDWLRRSLLLEPRGHAEMYGAFLVTPPAGSGAHAATLFAHCSGYSTMCGHATIALGRYLFDRSVAAGAERRRFLLASPCGTTSIEVDPSGDVPGVSFDSVVSFARLDQRVKVPGFGTVEFDLGYGGAYYAILPAMRMGLSLHRSPLHELAAAAGALVETARRSLAIDHPAAPDLGFLYGAILTDDTYLVSGEVSRNLCWFGAGQLDRSPTGSGVAARIAVAAARGLFGTHDLARIAGLSGESFEARLAHPPADAGVTVRVSGRAFYMAMSEMILEPQDPFSTGLDLSDPFGVAATADGSPQTTSCENALLR